jgi:hypothetical protein
MKEMNCVIDIEDDDELKKGFGGDQRFELQVGSQKKWKARYMGDLS